MSVIFINSPRETSECPFPVTSEFVIVFVELDLLLASRHIERVDVVSVVVPRNRV